MPRKKTDEIISDADAAGVVRAERILRTKKKLPASRAEMLEKFKDYPGLKAFERALESPDGPGSLPILLKGDPSDPCMSSGHQDTAKVGQTRCRRCDKPFRFWYVHHVNTKQPGRVAKVKAKGMIPVAIDELLNKDEISDLVRDSPDGLVHTGPNGVRMLYKIPLELRMLRLKAERDSRTRRLSNPKAMREDLANDAGRALGSEAADMVYSGLEYSEKSVRTSLGEELGAGRDE